MTPSISHRHPGRRQSGVSLIEVLVAILLVALGILAMAAMQANSTRIAKTTEFRAMGALLAADLADRMRANSAGVLYRAKDTDPATNYYKFEDRYPSDGVVDIDDDAPDCDNATSNCTPQQIASYDLIQWRKAVAASLPGGWVRVSDVDTSGASPPENAVNLWLIWVDPDNTLTSSDAASCPANMMAPPPKDEEEGEDDEEKPKATTVTPRCMYFRINL